MVGMSSRSSGEVRREKRMNRSSSLPLTLQPAGREARNRTGDIPVARRNAQAKALGLVKPTERLTSETLLPLQEMFRVVRPGGKVVVMDAVRLPPRVMDLMLSRSSVTL